MKLLAIINSLDRGGAEVNLLRLARDLQPDLNIVILPLRRGGGLSGPAQAEGVQVLPPGFVSLLRCWLRPPARVVEGWLYAGAVVASLFRLRGCVIVWNLRHVPTDLRLESRVTRLCLSLLRRMRRPDRIHTNSKQAIAAHTALGIDGDYHFIANGIDSAHYHNDPAGARALRAALGVSEHASLVVNVARAHPHKGHRVLFEAMAPLLDANPDVHLVCFGSGVPDLDRVATDLRLPSDQVHLCDALDDVVGAFSAARVVVNASLTESSPTALVEAMSCGAVCVATAAGGTADLLGDVGTVVPVGDAPALSAAIRVALALPADERAERARRARRRATDVYDAKRCRSAYRQSIAQLAGVR